jgi:nifR3 family TIM-barrel protein
MDLLEQLKANPFVLAPMAGITDKAFRSFMRKMGTGIVVTELVSATGLRHSSEKTRRLMEFDQGQRPVGIQIFGYSLEDLDFAAKEVEQMGADFVDLNFGCPVPKVVKKGAGSAILKDPIRLREVLRTVKSAVTIPVTIKVRTGWDAHSRNAIEVAQIAADEGITWMAIHGRTRAQAYSGEADWDYIKAVKDSSPIPILGNGDLTSASKAVNKLKESGCDGVMIGRGCLKNPWIFEESLVQWKSGDESYRADRNFNKVFKDLREELESFFDERLTALQLKKLAAWFSHGYPGSAQFRKKIFQSKSAQEVSDCIEEYFQTNGQAIQADTSNEAFLMGGHG